jgi:hypothetical protein
MASLARSSHMLNQYVSTAHSPQNALDIFRRRMVSSLPEPYGDLKAGQASLFCDARIHWFRAR